MNARGWVVNAAITLATARAAPAQTADSSAGAVTLSGYVTSSYFCTSGVLGFPAAPGRKIGSGTVTLNVKSWPHALVRPRFASSTRTGTISATRVV